MADHHKWPFTFGLLINFGSNRKQLQLRGIIFSVFQDIGVPTYIPFSNSKSLLNLNDSLTHPTGTSPTLH